MRVAVIPARGGSKRIPRKNVREFAGKPMIAHSIECALKSGVFDRIIVSTDDDEIASIAGEHGAEVPFRRPPELADDNAGTTEVIAHATRALLDAGHELSAVCCIYATAPFIRADDLKSALAVLEAGSWKFVFPATTFAFPVFRAFQQSPSGGIKMFYPEHRLTRSQDLPEALHDAGQFYWGRPDAWLRHEEIFGSSSTVVRVPRWRVQDIDTPEDWSQMELMAELLQRAESAE